MPPKSCILLLLLVACFEVPPPLTHRLVETGEVGGGGVGGEGGAGGDGGVADGGSGGGDALPPPLPMCEGPADTNCARVNTIHAASDHTCANMSDGTLRCWGSNESHQVGAPAEPQGYFVGPVVVANLREPGGVALGGRHSCAIASDGAVWCWGRNHLGQLGTGDTSFRDAPTRVFDAATELSATDATCARSDAGEVHCWGVILNGQAWEADFGEHTTTPVLVDLGGPASAISVGSRHACAVVNGGDEVVCWGNGSSGKLGDGSATDSGTPVSVANTLATPVHLLSAGADQNCVLAGDPPAVQCWGFATNVGAVPTPTTLAPQPAGDISDVQCGWRHCCAMATDGRVQCWGLNASHQLGNAGPSSATPVDVEGLTDAAQLAVGGSHNCVVRTSGAVACWGDNRSGQLSQPPSLELSEAVLDVDLEITP